MQSVRGPRLVLDGVSFHIDRGETLGLVGESGSGKSTTARALLADLPVNAEIGGQALVDGRDVLTMAPRDLAQLRSRTIAMIGQNPRAAMNPVRRVGDFAMEALRTNFGMTKTEARERIVPLLAEVGLNSPETLLGQYPHQLSGGMLQRVVIATALATGPALIIADEPTSALDTLSQADVIGILNRLRSNHDVAMLFITHDLDLAASVCDRTAVMYAGRIVESQSSHRLLTRPQHPYSAGLASARVRVDVDIERLTAIPGRPVAAFDRPAHGCPFAPRCAFAQDKCLAESPTLVETKAGSVECWRHEEIEAMSLPSAVRITG
ncbi:MAG: ABC transporter ATP-binding protein [Microbacteriaceae bacterium]|nr:MAG: ABC transporter ATP-binding protein [Microbacteriaceae bacterium]